MKYFLMQEIGRFVIFIWGGGVIYFLNLIKHEKVFRLIKSEWICRTLYSQ